MRMKATALGTPAAVWVVKIGGRLLEERDSREALARACASLEPQLVLVHGGGSSVTHLQAQLGLESRFVGGRRVTTESDLQVVEMMLSGTLNKALARDLERAGRPSAGIAASDAGLVRCDLVPGLGRVGIPARVDAALLRALLDSGFTPVVSPVSLGPDGGPVNVNADELAGALAVALAAERLLLLSDVDGVRVESAWRDTVSGSEVESLIERGEVTDGMVPKLRTAAVVLAGGVGEVRIAGFATGSLASVRGTRVLSDPEVQCDAR